MKNIVFDLGGVLFARDKRNCTQEFIDFFSFIRQNPMPDFWVEYDRGALSLDEVTDILSEMNHTSREKTEAFLQHSIDIQEPIRPTEELIGDLKKAGYRLYVLSNMSREFIDFLRKFPVYSLFDGDVVSCEEHTVKPEPRIFEILLNRFSLEPSETLFIDDRADNVRMAESMGIRGFNFDDADRQKSCDELRALLLK